MIGSISDVASEIRKITDSSYSDFEGFPRTAIQVAERWGEVIDVLGSGVTPPSTTTAAAKATFISIMLGASQMNAGIPTLISACVAYAGVLSTGMQPAFTGIPPIIPPVIAPTGLITGSAEIEAYSLATVLRTWLGTGTAVNNSSGVTIPWL